MTSAWEVADAIAGRRLSAVDAARECLAAIEARDGEINAYTVVLRDEALAQAAGVDRRIAAGEQLGPLAGVPVSIKDQIWLAGAPATNGSRVLAEFRPGTSAVAVDRLLEAGAVVLGKTNNPEFCYRGVTTNDLYGTTRNPRDLSRTTGGSSGGAAASVAAGMARLALGSDGGGSVRIPAGFCGVAGLKPTFGLVPTTPGFRGWPSLSVVGPIASCVRDLALAMTVLSGPAPQDPTSVAPPRPLDFLDAVRGASLHGLRIAASATLGLSDLDDDVRGAFERALDTLRRSGVRIDLVHPDPVDVCALWDATALPEGNASQGQLLADRPDLIGADAAAIIESGDGVSARAYLDAQAARSRFTTSWLQFLSEYDVLLTPSLPVTAFAADRLGPATVAGRAVPDGFDAWCALLLPANLAGLPAASVPIGPAGALPVGMQVVGTRFADDVVLRAAAAIEHLMEPS
ncbi:amidase [Allobranchiibius sp. GilTou73]|uniref:amidase n=1 Tax=Allobranchiibius sp. GilTou73 TaxID=2904523 RepID=UPI001EED225A|nr:amidase family protein [Allobranchiibius sp. GilTou73]UIJ35166.1 amidase [Allobranchiibius sp. GilTou73]